MYRTVHRKISWLFLFSVFCLCLVGRLILLNKQDAEKTGFRINHTWEIIGALDQINDLVSESQVAAFGYIISADGAWKSQLLQTRKNLQQELGRLQQITGDNAIQQKNWESLISLLEQKQLIEDSLSDSKNPVFENDRRFSFGLRIQHTTRAIKSALYAMKDEEANLLAESQSLGRLVHTKAMWALVTGSLLTFMFVIVILVQLNKDITLRKKAEQGLHQNELKYRNLVENAAAVIYSTDSQGHINFSSEKATELTGYTVEELKGRHFASLVDPSFLDRVVANYANQFKTGTVETSMVFLIVTKNGEKKWVEQSAVLLMEKDIRLGFQCFVKDISEKKQMQLELEASEFKLKENQLWLQSILDNTTSLIFIKDLSGRYILINKRFKEILGVEEDQVIHKTDYDLTSRELADHYKMLDEEVIRTGRSVEREELVRTTGGDRNLLLIKFPLLDGNNKVFGVSGIATDITERAHYQQELIKATKEAEEARQMQEQFLANMSHEIRTPMNGIQGMTNLLLDTSLSEQQAEFAHIIRRSTGNLLVIINDILDFSKIKAGKLTIEKIDFNLQDVLSNAQAVFSHRLLKNNLDFRIELDPSIPDLLRGDPHRLNQVLINLIGNAIKFTEHGSIRVAVSRLTQTDTGVVLRFSVSDTGIGISEEDLPHIFESFSQAGLDISRRYGGTGLGLAICNQLLKLQKGDISVTSVTGQGSSFNFRIPYEYSNRQSGQPVLAKVYDYAGLLAGKRFLVAEDNEVNQKLIEYVLRKVGGIVRLAGNGEQAIRELQQDAGYDIIIMDLQMPVMDGYAATRHIRTVLRLETPIIAMTATALKGEQLRCFEAGMNEYMTKPFEFTELYKCIGSLLGKKETALSPVPAAIQEKTAEKPYDLALLEEMDDKEYLLDMLNLFLTNMPVQLEELVQASGRQDFDKVFSVAHKLKGTAGMLRTQALMDQLVRIETGSRERMDTSGMVRRAADLFTQLEGLLQEEKSRVEGMLGKVV
ncbi:MAG: PAS domain S-box protein [Puia sp.]|nr:PAS domain S-box protein [Puia sp.]